VRNYLAVAIVFFVIPRAAWGYAEIPFTLGWLLSGTENIVVLKMAKVSLEKKVVIYEKVKDVLGEYPHQELKLAFGRMGTTRKKQDEELLAATAVPGRTVIMFCTRGGAGRAGFCYTGNWWYDCYTPAPDQPIWIMRWGAPMLCWAYCGSIEKLLEVAPAIKKGQEVIVPALQNDGYSAIPELEKGLLKGQAKPPIWRIKASLKIRDYPRDANNKLVVGLGTGDVGAVSGLVKMLQSKTKPDVASAAEALGQIGPDAREAYAPLVKCLGDADHHVRVSAAEALLRIADRKLDLAPVAAALAAMMQDADTPVRLRVAATLRKLGPKAEPAVASLKSWVSDTNLEVRRAAAWALIDIGGGIEEAVPVLAQELKRDKAMGATDDWRLRRAAAQTLERLGVKAKAAAPALAAAMENDDYRVSQSAAKALLAMGPEAQAAIPTLILIVERKLTPAKEVKNSYMMQPHKAAEILGRIGPAAKSAIPALEQLAKDANADYRQAALDALKRIR
jgi:HEAT repeat protein